MRALSSRVLLALLPALAVSQSSPSAPLANPTQVPCPNVPLIRSAGPPAQQSLSSGESSYVSSRADSVLPDAWKAYLDNVNAASSPPLPRYVAEILTCPSEGLPKLGIATSGGGYRAAFFGAAALTSLDGRNTTSVAKGTGGLLQAATYLAGLSGGSWLTLALSQANFPTFPELIFPPAPATSPAGDPNAAFGGFIPQFDITAPGPTAQDTLAYIEVLLAESKAKQLSSGLPITITDPWSRGLARHFVNGTTAQNVLGNGTHGAGILLSGLTSLPSFQAHAQPFPIVVVNSIPPNPNVSEIVPGDSVPLTSEIWEFNVFESGSWDPSLGSFIPTALLGSTNSSNCMAGLDQVSFIQGLSSNIFNEFNVSGGSLQASPIGPLVSLVEASFPGESVRYDAGAVPNPFKGVNPATYTNANEDFLALVDGGSDGEVVPLQPLLVRARGIDTIIAIDAAADTTENFTNGTDLINTAKRAALFGAQYPFPAVPATPAVFVQQGLNRRPTFFGCDEAPGTPMVIYIANGGPPLDGGAAPVTNTSTGQTTYSPQEAQAFLDQAYAIATQGIDGTGAGWGTCLACAVVDRARARRGAVREGVCAACLARYCWTPPGSQGSHGAPHRPRGATTTNIMMRGDDR
ncbi:lysophospholipase catalytic domain-containing protein [Gautieria morchelliformis]|nr:lysophospholipase catalytic domain-containing protein [Gautieria morchelliformis]